MEQAVIEAIKQTPALAVLAWVVWIFLKYWQSNTAADRDLTSAVHQLRESLAPRKRK